MIWATNGKKAKLQREGLAWTNARYWETTEYSGNSNYSVKV